jgi:DnaJ family protein C protein 28
LQKEIADDTKHFRESLARCRTELGHLPLNNDDKYRWNEVLTKHKEMAKKLNAKIDKYNLLVPLLEKQKLHILLERESENILKTGATRYDVTNHAAQASRNQHAEDHQSDFLSFFGSFYLW